MSHLEVQQGELLWQDRKVPFEFNAGGLTLLLNHSLLRQRYEAHVSAGSVATRVQQYPTFVWRADAALILARGHADISSLTITSGKSEIHFAGRLQDFHNPQVSGDYHGVADLGELTSAIRPVEVRKRSLRRGSPETGFIEKGLNQRGLIQRGTAQFEGKGSWSLQIFSTQGTVQAKDIEWSNGKLSMRNGRLSAGFSVTPDRFHVSSIKANLLGGDLLGDADVMNWQNSLPNPLEPSSVKASSVESSSVPARRHLTGRVSQGGLQRGSVHMQVAGFPLLPALQLVSSKSLPLDQLALSGSTSGIVEMLWVGSIRDAETRVKVSIVPPLKPTPNEIPVLGQIDGVYRGSRDELEMSQLHLTTPGSEINAVGSLAAASSLRFSLTSHNLKEWTPLINAAWESFPDLPFAVHGWASFTGNARAGSSLRFRSMEILKFMTLIPLCRPRGASLRRWFTGRRSPPPCSFRTVILLPVQWVASATGTVRRTSTPTPNLSVEHLGKTIHLRCILTCATST